MAAVPSGDEGLMRMLPVLREMLRWDIQMGEVWAWGARKSMRVVQLRVEMDITDMGIMRKGTVIL